MGTYCKIVLKDKSEENIKKVNEELTKRNFPTEYYNGIPYGAFNTREQINEDVRFMNEDEEGLKQMTHWKRPITFETLDQFFWNKIGHFHIKLSGGHIENVKMARIVSLWAFVNQSKIDLEESDNWEPVFVSNYLK